MFAMAMVDLRQKMLRSSAGGAILFVIVAGFIFALMKGKDGYRDLDEIAHKEEQ